MKTSYALFTFMAIASTIVVQQVGMLTKKVSIAKALLAWGYTDLRLKIKPLKLHFLSRVPYKQAVLIQKKLIV
jgi:hypothetical protein